MQSNLFQSFKIKRENKMEVEKQKGREKVPWIEKYRPNQLDEISHQNEIVKALKGIKQTGNVPHLLLYGPPGTGKTSCILALAKEFFGIANYRQRVLELNASDERGIKVVREKIKKFAQQIPQKISGDFKHPNIKIIVLDEADIMTNDAQSALRRIIEDYSSTTRFCIICNYVTQIIAPLSSRCIKYQFMSLSVESQLEKLKYICGEENIRYDKTALVELIGICKGDLRRSINLLQSASIIYDHISIDNIQQISDKIPEHVLSDLMKKVKNCSSVDDLIKIGDQFLCEGYSGQQLISQLIEDVLRLEWMKEEKKVEMMIKIGEIEQNLAQGARDSIQIYQLLTSIRF